MIVEMKHEKKIFPAGISAVGGGAIRQCPEVLQS